MSSLSSETSFFSSCGTTGQEENMTTLPESPEMSSKIPKSSTLPPKWRKIKAAASLGTAMGFDGPGQWSTRAGRSPHRSQGNTHRSFISRPQHEQADFQIALGPRREILWVREQQPFSEERVF